MKKLLGPLFLFVIFVAACQAPAAEDTFTDADFNAIKADVDGFTTALLEGRFADVAATYAEDTVFMPPYQENVHGRDGLLAWFEAFPPISAMEFTDVEISGTGDLAYATGHFTMTFAPDGENFIDDAGTFLEIRRRSADGDWLVIRDIFNSSMPPPGGE